MRLYRCKNMSFLEREQYVWSVTPATAADCQTGTGADVWIRSIWCWWETSPPQPLTCSLWLRRTQQLSLCDVAARSNHIWWEMQPFSSNYLQKSGELSVLIVFYNVHHCGIMSWLFAKSSVGYWAIGYTDGETVLFWGAICSLCTLKASCR